jgi:hypothetical protein
MRGELVTSARDPYAYSRIMSSQQVAGHERAAKARALAERPDVGDSARTSQLLLDERRKLSEGNRLSVDATRAEVKADTQHPAQPRKWHPANQHLDDTQNAQSMHRRKHFS